MGVWSVGVRNCRLVVRVIEMEWVKVLGVEAEDMVMGQITQSIGGPGGQEGARWKSCPQVRKSRALSPHLLAVSSVLVLCHAAQAVWAPSLRAMPVWWQASSAFSFRSCLQPDLFRPV